MLKRMNKIDKKSYNVKVAEIHKLYKWKVIHINTD